MKPETARLIWQGLEHLNAVTYFAPECRDATASLGLRGFWAGYFACRAAPMGAVAAGVVEATFFNFHPARVRKDVPAVWDVAPPARVVEVRAEAAATALRRLLPPAEHLAHQLVPSLVRCIEVADGAGRVLFCANREMMIEGVAVEDLWQASTTLREQRGDGHVAVLVSEGLDGCEAHVLMAATVGLPSELFQASRGWSVEDWESATVRMVDRGLVAPEGTPTELGIGLHERVERRTDELAALPFRALSEDALDRLVKMLGHAAAAMAATELIPYPNPMGLPAPAPA